MHTVIIVAETFSILYLLILFFGLVHSREKQRTAVMFGVCLLVAVGGVGVDLLSYVLEYTFVNSFWLIVVNMLAFVGYDFELMAFAIYVWTIVSEKEKVSWIFVRYINGLCLADVLFVLIGTLNGKLFYIENGNFIEGSWYNYGGIIGFIVLTSLLIFAVKKRKSVGYKPTMFVAIFFVSTYVPIFITFFTGIEPYTYVCMSLIMLLVYIILQTGEIEQGKLHERIACETAASRAKTDFLFNMSHDIRTPMNAILGYTEVAIKHRDNQEIVDDCLEKISFAGRHLLDLINDVLEMSRIESDRLEITDEPSDIRKLIEGVDQMSKALAIKKSIDFKTEVGDIANPYVYIDSLHANEVLINLTSNAIKYTASGGKIRFKVNQGDLLDDKTASFCFIVEDDGIGMSEEFQKHMFEAFSRERTSTVSKQQGTGLGLSITKRIVDIAGGTIKVNSKPNEGSTFIVEVPLRIMDEEAIKKYEEDNKPKNINEKDFSLENKKVLMVEDNEMNREIATEILEDAGLIVDTAEDGAFALKAIEEKGIDFYDFILMDIQMPVMDGYQATKAIRALPDGDKLTIISLSANAFEEDVKKSLEVGMNAHVAKPIDVKNLLKTMKELAK